MCEAIDCRSSQIGRCRPFCDICWSMIKPELRDRIVTLAEPMENPAPAQHDPRIFLLVMTAKLNLAITRKDITGEESAARMALACHRASEMGSKATTGPA